MIKKYYPNEVVQSLIAGTDIVGLIEKYVGLKNQNNRFSGLCPFHQEKTPSFSVNPEGQYYHCFGCHVGGNAIDFVMRYHSLDFISAIEFLAEFNGIELKSQQKTSKYDWAYELNQKACDFFISSLNQSNSAKQYLKRRGLSDEIIKQFAIGYAPNLWDGLKNHLTENKTESEASQMIKKGLSLGLFSTSKNKIFDKYRDRIIFPIRNKSGKIVGFGGRVLNDALPKYLNSQASDIFLKSSELYGLFEMNKKYGMVDKIVMVEGYTDVIALFNHNIKYALASLGTAITTKHLENLQRLTKELIFCFDGDDAGKNAAIRGIKIALPFLSENFNLQLLWLNKNEDPDSFIQNHSKTEFENKLNDSQNWADFLIKNSAKKYDISLPVEKEKLISELKLIYQNLKNSGAKRILVDYASEFLSDDKNRLESIFDPNLVKNQTIQTHFEVVKKPDRAKLPKRTKPRILILILILYPNIIEKIRNEPELIETISNKYKGKELIDLRKEILQLIGVEDIIKLNVEEIDCLKSVLEIIEENKNINTALMLGELRNSDQYEQYYDPLIQNQSHFLLGDYSNHYDVNNAINDFLDSFQELIRIDKKNKGRQRVDEYKNKENQQ